MKITRKPGWYCYLYARTAAHYFRLNSGISICGKLRENEDGKGTLEPRRGLVRIAKCWNCRRILDGEKIKWLNKFPYKDQRHAETFWLANQEVNIVKTDERGELEYAVVDPDNHDFWLDAGFDTLEGAKHHATAMGWTIKETFP